MHSQSYGKIYRRILRTRKMRPGVLVHATHTWFALFFWSLCDGKGEVCKLPVKSGLWRRRRVGPGIKPWFIRGKFYVGCCNTCSFDKGNDYIMIKIYFVQDLCWEFTVDRCFLLSKLNNIPLKIGLIPWAKADYRNCPMLPAHWQLFIRLILSYKAKSNKSTLPASRSKKIFSSQMSQKFFDVITGLLRQSVP